MRMWNTMLVAAVLATDASAQPASRQKLYEAAQAAYDRGDDQAAVDGFAQVLNPEGHDSRSDGQVRYRYAYALQKLQRSDEALLQATRAARELAASANGADSDLAAAYKIIGDRLRDDLRMEDSLAAYVKAKAALPAGEPSLLIDVGVITAAMVTHPDQAAAAADKLIADQATFAKLQSWDRAYLLSLRARAELNRNAPRAAVGFIQRAVQASGPLTANVSIAQARVRSDAGLIYTKIRDIDSARRYLAYSGAGYMPDNNWLSSDLELPICGDDVQPQDVAVVEFSIDKNGTVAAAEPIYASRPGEMGVIFARAVRAWTFRPDIIAGFSDFWRSAVRVELRCLARPDPRSIHDRIDQAEMDWWKTRGLANFDRRSVSETATIGHEFPRLVQAMKQIGNSSSLSGTKIVAIDDELVAAHASPAARAAMARGLSDRMNAYSGLVRNAAARAAVLGDLITRIASASTSDYVLAWLRLEQAIEWERAGRFDTAGAVLDSVVATPRVILPDDDPVRHVATLHRALIEGRAGDKTAAEARLSAAGLDAQQCTLFDVRPVAANAPISNAIFPSAALQWGMEGYAREAFDIAADGSVTGVRTVLAYPPFVFGDASEQAISKFRYVPMAIGGTPLGCSGRTESIRYAMPDRPKG